MYRKICHAVFFLLFVVPAWAQHQQFIFRNYSSKDGLSNSMVYDFYRDDKGFLWIGTDDGLNCFDGYQFKVFRLDPKNPTSLNNNQIWKIQQDSWY